MNLLEETPIIHFSGNFFYHVPHHNNSNEVLSGERLENLNESEIVKEYLEKFKEGEPDKIFEFETSEARVTRISFGNSFAMPMVKEKNEIFNYFQKLLNLPIIIKGFLVDVSPTITVGQLYAGRLRVGRLLRSEVSYSLQSPLKLGIRDSSRISEEEEISESIYLSSWFFAKMKNVEIFTKKRFQFLNQDMEISFRLSHFHSDDDVSNSIQDKSENYQRLEGNIHGYFKPIKDDLNKNRFSNRKLVMNQKFPNNRTVSKNFLFKVDDAFGFEVGLPEGYYTILKKEKLIEIRFLDFILSRYKYNRKECWNRNDYFEYIEGYEIHCDIGNGFKPLRKNNYQLSIDKISSIEENEKMIISGSPLETMLSGGLMLFHLPVEYTTRKKIKIEVKIISSDPIFGGKYSYLVEPDSDISINVKKPIRIEEGAKQSLVLFLEDKRNSCEVINIKSESNKLILRNKNGKILNYIKSSNSAINIIIQCKRDCSMSREVFSGEYLKFLNKRDEIIFQLPVRIFPEISKNLTSSDEKKMLLMKFLLTEYERLFPGVHYKKCKTDKGFKYIRFVNFSEFYNSRILRINSSIISVIRRIGLNNDDISKMPRSRDWAFRKDLIK